MSDNNDQEIFIDIDDLSEELGYTEYDWANLSEEESDRHNEIIEMSEEEVIQLDLDGLNDLHKWAAAQVLFDADNDRGEDLARALIFGERKHPAINYLELAVEFCFDHVLEDKLETAREILAVIHELADADDSTPLEFEALILFAESQKLEGPDGKAKESAAMAKYQDIIEDFGDDPETLLNLASHFGMFGMMERANELIDQAETLARAENDQELVEVIEEFRVHLNEEEDGDDA